MKVVDFAWVRERIGKAEEELEIAAQHSRPSPTLVRWLPDARGRNMPIAFDNRRRVRAALDRTHVKPEAIIASAREIAFFPPMTGG